MNSREMRVASRSWKIPRQSSLPFDEEPNSQGDLRIFLKYLREVKNLLENNDDYSSEQCNQLLGFIDIIKNPEKAVISGSSVLELHLKKSLGSSDIDIFVSGHDQLKYFTEILNTDVAKEIFAKALKNFIISDADKLSAIANLDQPYDTREINAKMLLRRIFFTKTTGEYPFTNNSFDLKTGRLIIDNLFDINFIFVEKVREGEATDPELNFPHVAHIFHNFDFHELKRFYNFEDNYVKNIPFLFRELFKKFGYNLEGTHHNLMINGKLAVYENYINDFDERYSDPEVLSISTRMRDRLRRLSDEFHSSFSQKRSLEENDKALTEVAYRTDSVTPQVIGFIATILPRIEKYKNRGFVIKDPDACVLRANFILQIFTYIITKNLILQKIERNTILVGDHEDKTLFKILHSFREDIENKNIYKNFSEPDRGITIGF